MKKAIALIVSILSLSAFSSTYAPIAEDIIACYANIDTANSKSDLVMLRHSVDLDGFPVRRISKDMLVSYSGTKRTMSRSHGIAQFNREGTTELSLCIKLMMVLLKDCITTCLFKKMLN